MLRKISIINLIIFLLGIYLPAQSRYIKIGLSTSKAALIGTTTEGSLYEISLSKELFKTQPNVDVKVLSKNGKIIFERNGILEEFNGPITLTPSADGFVRCNKINYRGKLLIIPSKITQDEITIINDVDLEDYLLSVVPSEMPPKWHLEALKAQAVAARSYSVGYLGRRKEKGYDLESTVEDQVYNGLTSERPSTTQAVKETKGQILLNEKNEPLIAFFHSSAGGHTDSIENVWKFKKIEPSPYIQPKKDYDKKSPHFNWNRSFTLGEIDSKINSTHKIGNVLEIKPTDKYSSGRIQQIKLVGTKDQATLFGEEFRMLFKLPSSKFDIVKKDDTYFIYGMGYGHGLGLSQWGSKALAEKGESYKNILSHYYSDAKIITLSDEVKN